jgi:predicted amidohydrolase
MRVKVAVVQTNPKLGDLAYNLEQTIHRINVASSEGAKLVVFPECSLTGYCYNSDAEVKSNALVAGEEWTVKLTNAAHQADVYIVVGFIELFAGKVYNSLLVIGPNGMVGRYRKVHLPNIGCDNFVSPGNQSFSVIETPVGRLGALICYDVRFPEQARILALQGADILVHITNLPLTAASQVDFLLPARAIENRAFVLSADRVGEERGFRFLGRSSIFSVDGETLAQANETDETIIYAELDLSLSRQKKVFYPAIEGKPVDHINDLIGSRRPELYTLLTHK